MRAFFFITVFAFSWLTQAETIRTSPMVESLLQKIGAKDLCNLNLRLEGKPETATSCQVIMQMRAASLESFKEGELGDIKDVMDFGDSNIRFIVTVITVEKLEKLRYDSRIEFVAPDMMLGEMLNLTE